PAAFQALVRRHRLAATGNGKARRFPRATVEFLRGLAGRGRSVQTINYYLREVKSFCRWMVKDRRLPDNPLAHLAGGNAKTHRRHDRRPLAAGELRSLIRAARESARTFRGLAGADRAVLYCAACATGFRAGELAVLVPGDFRLDADPPTVTIAAED